MTTATKTIKAICVWLDDASDPDNPTWIVSLDALDRDGNAVTTKTLDTADTKGEALAEARPEARKRGLPLCENSDGAAEEIASAGLLRMEAVLLSHGSRFSGNNVADEAQEWLDQGFDADSADDWCEIGCWDAATAAALRDAGLTPEQAHDAADKMSEECEDAAEVYTDGDPIYSACNGDTSVAEIVAAAK